MFLMFRREGGAEEEREREGGGGGRFKTVKRTRKRNGDFGS